MILVIHKKSRYQQLVLEREDEDVERLLAQRDVSVARLERSHEAHTRSLEHICEVLEARGQDFEVRARGEAESPDHYDLVITVGGDGTVLDLSHQVSWTPVLAINSDPEASVGYFCAGTADDFEGLLEKTLTHQWQPTKLCRFAVRINDDERTPPALNEVLVCHANPAAVSSYLLRVDGHEEAQRSSGIWIATPAGSTAAIRSAGGLVLPINSHNFQFLVREPYPPKSGSYRQVKGIRPFGTEVELVSKMEDGRIYIDGPHISYPFTIGDRIRLDFSAPPLLAFGLDDQRRNA